jgi:hypothetical protein
MAPKAKAGGGGSGGGADGGADNLTVEQQAALAEQERLTQKAYDNKVRGVSCPTAIAQRHRHLCPSPALTSPGPHKTPSTDQVIAKAPPLNNLEPLPISNGERHTETTNRAV